MTSINFPKDDVAVRESRIKNVTSPSVTAVNPTSATAKTAEVGANSKVKKSRSAIRQRNKKDRRQKDRRKKQVKVLLDTRNHQERRKRVRRGDDLLVDKQEPEDSAQSPSKGIDVYS